MQEYFDAWRLELESHIRQATGTSVGTALREKWTKAEDGYRAALEGLDTLPGAGSVGSAARMVTRFVAGLPGISAPSDFARAHNCVDLCEQDKLSWPERPVTALHLIQARLAMRRDLVFIRTLRRVADPSGLATTLAVKALTGLGAKQSQVSQDEASVRSAHRLVLLFREKTTEFDQLHSLAKVFLLADQPGHAVQFSLRAAEAASRERETTETRKGVGQRLAAAWRGGGMSSFLDELADSCDQVVNDNLGSSYLDAECVPPARLAGMRMGIALTTAAWGYHALGDEMSAREAAATAVASGSSCGHEVGAALLTGSDVPNLLDRVGERARLLTEVRRIDHAHYHGHWRGDLRTGHAVVTRQAQRIGLRDE